MYIKLTDLGLFLLFSLAVAIGIYLILVLRQALAALSRIKNIVIAQDAAIQQSLSQLPGLLANLSALSLSLKSSSDSANKAIGSFQEELAVTVDDIKENLEVVTMYSKAIGEVVRTVLFK